MTPIILFDGSTLKFKQLKLVKKQSPCVGSICSKTNKFVNESNELLQPFNIYFR